MLVGIGEKAFRVLPGFHPRNVRLAHMEPEAVFDFTDERSAERTCASILRRFHHVRHKIAEAGLQ